MPTRGLDDVSILMVEHFWSDVHSGKRGRVNVSRSCKDLDSMAESYIWAKRVQPGAFQLRRLENIRGKNVVVQLMAIQEWEASQIAEDLIWRRKYMNYLAA